MAQNHYRIGTISVYMTAAQAEAWNSGDATRESMAGAIACIPGVIGAGSHIRDGEVVMVHGLPTHDEMDLWGAIQNEDGSGTELYEKYMDGESSILFR